MQASTTYLASMLIRIQLLTSGVPALIVLSVYPMDGLTIAARGLRGNTIIDTIRLNDQVK